MWLSITCYILNFFSFYYPCTFLHLLGAGLVEESRHSLRGGPKIRSWSSVPGVLWTRKDGGGGGRIKGGRFLWASEGSSVTFLHILSPTSPKKVFHTPSATISDSPPQEFQELQSFWSCQTGARINLCNCFSSSRGRDTGQYATPSYSVWGIKRVYRCQDEGCREGPSTSCATICVYIRQVHLGVGLVCPLYSKSFFNPDTFRCHKKSFKHVNRGRHIWGSVNI